MNVFIYILYRWMNAKIFLIEYLQMYISRGMGIDVCICTMYTQLDECMMRRVGLARVAPWCAGSGSRGFESQQGSTQLSLSYNWSDHTRPNMQRHTSIGLVIILSFKKSNRSTILQRKNSGNSSTFKNAEPELKIFYAFF